MQNFGVTIAPTQQHIKHPTFSGRDGLGTLREAAIHGWGVSAMCCDCHASVKRPAKELLDRFWRSANLALGEIMSHVRCPHCGSHRLILATYQSERFDRGHKQAAFLAMREAQVEARLRELAYELAVSQGYPSR